MSTAYQQSIFTTIPTYHQLLLRQVRDATNAIQSLDIENLTLSVLHWYMSPEQVILSSSTSDILHRPMNQQERVPPSELREHRQSHEFLGPCCLCPLFVPNGKRVFTEAAMFIAASGPFSGEYVAQCAKGECGYLGQSPFLSWIELGTHTLHTPVFLEHIYAKFGAPLRRYPLRGE